MTYNSHGLLNNTDDINVDVDRVAVTSTTSTTTTTVTTTMTTSVPECMIENNIAYSVNDINNGGDPQNDAQSCRSFCKSNYPTAKYFTLGTANNCRCKTSNSGRKVNQGAVSGNVMCVGEFCPNNVVRL